RVPDDFVRNLAWAFPPLDEQATIANFLDCETAKIDALIAEQEKLIALLAEKRQATISHAVTRGLDPDAPMKDSGVAWLGEVPAHWEVKRMKHLVRESIAGPYGSSLTKSMYESSGYRVYGQQQVIPDDFSVGDYYISEAKFEEMTRYRVEPGDVLISVMGTIGRAAVVPERVEPGIINPRLVLYRVIDRLVSPRYLQCFLNNPTSQRYFSLAAQGTTMEGLNMVSIGELYVALPPLDEQVKILDFVRREEQKLDQLSEEAERAIALLKERRSALIAAAVTGQIDVRDTVTD
ncbi:MAG TPA: restriction endonuclease subunit S, partial [Pseudorhodoferax sp.]|nr:restriction endonuclease subunit S [Pseudorhodoferax sp.]